MAFSRVFSVLLIVSLALFVTTAQATRRLVPLSVTDAIKVIAIDELREGSDETRAERQHAIHQILATMNYLPASVSLLAKQMAPGSLASTTEILVELNLSLMKYTTDKGFLRVMQRLASSDDIMLARAGLIFHYRNMGYPMFDAGELATRTLRAEPTLHEMAALISDFEKERVKDTMDTLELSDQLIYLERGIDKARVTGEIAIEDLIRNALIASPDLANRCASALNRIRPRK